MNIILDEDFEKKDRFIKRNIIKNILESITINSDFKESNKINKYFEYRENKIRQELNTIPVSLDDNQKTLIVQKLNSIKISFKTIPLKFQLYKAAIMTKNKKLTDYYNIEY